MKLLPVLLSLAGLLGAAAPPKVSQAQLNGLVSHWRHVLQLDDWRIGAIAVRLKDLPDGDAAYSETLEAPQILRIFVLDPMDYAEMAKLDGAPPKTAREIVRDIEDSIIHEMLHLRVRAYRHASQEEMPAAEELLVDRLTTAFLKVAHR